MNKLYLSFLLILCFLVLTGCKRAVETLDGKQEVTLMEGHGLVALGTNSLDYISSMKLVGTDSSHQVILKAIEKGEHLRLFQVPEGNYCVKEFKAYQRLFQYTNRTMCFYVEADEINYAGHYVFRAHKTTQISAEHIFLNQMKAWYPVVCRQFIGGSCDA